MAKDEKTHVEIAETRFHPEFRDDVSAIYQQSMDKFINIMSEYARVNDAITSGRYQFKPGENKEIINQRYAERLTHWKTLAQYGCMYEAQWQNYEDAKKSGRTEDMDEASKQMNLIASELGVGEAFEKEFDDAKYQDGYGDKYTKEKALKQIDKVRRDDLNRKAAQQATGAVVRWIENGQRDAERNKRIYTSKLQSEIQSAGQGNGVVSFDIALKRRMMELAEKQKQPFSKVESILRLYQTAISFQEGWLAQDTSYQKFLQAARSEMMEDARQVIAMKPGKPNMTSPISEKGKGKQGDEGKSDDVDPVRDSVEAQMAAVSGMNPAQAQAGGMEYPG